MQKVNGLVNAKMKEKEMNKNLTRETIFTKLVPSQTSFWDLQNLIIRTGVLGDIAF